MKTREQKNEYNRNYYRKNLSKIRERTRHYSKKSRNRTRAETIRVLGGKCSKCSFKDIRALQIDHINGGGSKERKYGYGWYKEVQNDALLEHRKYQLLCANCNWIKKFERREVPIGGNRRSL